MRHPSLPTITGAIALAAFGLLALPGCSSDRQPTAGPQPVQVDDLPDWVRDPTKGGKFPLAAAGSARWSLTGFTQSRDQAANNARVELGRVVSAKVQAVFKDWTREGGEITSQDSKLMAQTMAENISRTVTNQEINGTPQRELHHDKSSNTVFVWVYVDQEATKRIQDAMKAQTRADAEKRAYFGSKIEADKAFADLDKLIDKEMGLTP
jgi:hypothetical protein